MSINDKAIEKIQEALEAYKKKPLINEPMYISPRTYRDYDLYRWECGRAIGWNQAMDYIFGERKNKDDYKITGKHKI